MKLRFFLVGAAALAALGACTKVSAPLQLYLIGSSRFTSGNKTGLQPADTLATRAYITTNSASTAKLQRLVVRVSYSPKRQPFAYPQPITSFVYTNLQSEQLTYLDTTLTGASTPDFLFTNVFGVRTTSGYERWEYEATDSEGNTTTRSLITTVRRADSTQVYHDYLLRLNVPARGVSARRYIQLKSGLALPGYTVLGTANNPTPDQQGFTDLVQSVDGLRLFSPDTLGALLPATRWPATKRRSTRFRLTPLTAATFSSVQDTLGIRLQYASGARPRQALGSLKAGQVYAFRTQSFAGPHAYGLLLVKSTPGGTAAGLQLQVRVAKQTQDDAFKE